MSTSKANHYLQLLDVARCNGDWGAVPEWCRKVEKHAPGRKLLALVALTEARLNHLAPPPSDATTPTINNFRANLNALQQPLQEHLGSYATPLPNLPNPAGGGHFPTVTNEDILQARVTVAWILSLKEEWETVLDIVPDEEEVGEHWGLGGGKSDYIGAIRIKALVLKGLALSNINPADLSIPLQLYRAATRLPSTLPPPQRSLPAFLLWSEKALTNYALVTYRCWLEEHLPSSEAPPFTFPIRKRHLIPDEGGALQGGDEIVEDEREDEVEEVGVAIGKTLVDEATVTSAFRSFHNFVEALAAPPTVQGATAPPTAMPTEKGVTPEKQAERREVYRHYFKFLSFLLLPPDHPEKPKFRPSQPVKKAGNGNTVSVVGGGPSKGSVGVKAGNLEQLRAELLIVEVKYEDYLMNGLLFPRAEEYHEEVGEWVDQIVENWKVSAGSGDEAAPIVEILYRASTKTFHSPRILRHLFTTLTATGNTTDAVLALNTYLDLVQKAKERISKGHIEKDFDSDKIILETAVEGIRVVCKIIGDGKRGMEIAEQVEGWVEDWLVQDPGVLSAVYRGIGIANATGARQTVDWEKRSDIQNAAAAAFSKGLEYDDGDIEGWYRFAVVQAEMRQVDAAWDSTKRGLMVLKSEERVGEEDVEGRNEYRRRAVPLLHLLALLMTAREEFEGAQRSCESVFEILGNCRTMGVGEKEGVLEVKMTQIAILEAMEGSEIAARMTDELVALYSRLFGESLHQHMPSGSGNSDGYVQVESAVSSRPTTSSRRSRLLSRAHKQPFPSSGSNSSLPPPAASGETSGKSQSVRSRPKSGHQSIKDLTGLSSNSNAPKIQVTDASGGGGASTTPEKHHRKLMRPNSVSGGTIRRLKSVGSMKSSSASTREHRSDKKRESPTPPLPSSTDTSSVSLEQRSPAESLREHHNHPQMFHLLKSKLHNHEVQELSTAESSTLPQARGTRTESEYSARSRSPPRADTIPNNLPQDMLPHPLNPLAETITDERKTRNIRRPRGLPEPKLKEEDERRMVQGCLRRVWAFVAGLYRRAGYFEDARLAVDEAGLWIGSEGEGEGDVLAEKAFLFLAQGNEKEALEYFDGALAIDPYHPRAIVGISQILLEISEFSTIPAPPMTSMTTTTILSESPLSASPPPIVPVSLPPPSPSNPSQTEKEESLRHTLIARSRALGLLKSLTASPKGWDCSEAWYALSIAYETAGEVEKAKHCAWKVVELEDGRGVRGLREGIRGGVL